MTEKTEEKLEWVSCIWYPVTFKDQTKALQDLRSKINAMSQAFAHRLGLKIWKTNIRAQKIDGTTLETYEIVVSTFSMSDKENRERFFKESFLLADVKLDVVLGMPFLTMTNADVDFQARDLQWKFYITRDILSTTRRVKLIRKKKFVVAALNLEHETFVIYITALTVNLSDKVHPSKRA